MSTTDIQITDVRAGKVPLRVIAAKKPGHWIVRGMSPFTDWGTIRRCVEQLQGRRDGVPRVPTGPSQRAERSRGR